MRTQSLLVVIALSSSVFAAQPKKVTGQATLDAPTGAVQAMQTSDGEVPGRDVAKLLFDSDGKDLTVAATLTSDLSGTFATDLVQVYVDRDNDAATGGEATWGVEKGFEDEVELLICVEYESGAEACSGGAGGKAAAYYAVARVTDVASGNAAKSVFDLPKTPIEGKTVTAKVPYSDLGVKSGQTVRVYARKSSGPYDETSFYPAILLTLK